MKWPRPGVQIHPGLTLEQSEKNVQWAWYRLTAISNKKLHGYQKSSAMTPWTSQKKSKMWFSTCFLRSLKHCTGYIWTFIYYNSYLMVSLPQVQRLPACCCSQQILHRWTCSQATSELSNFNSNSFMNIYLFICVNMCKCITPSNHKKKLNS